MISTITIAGEVGYLFHGQTHASYCFVPEVYVTHVAEGPVIIDERRFFLDGWSLRNMRWNGVAAGGSHVFPVARRPVADLAAPGVVEFVTNAESRSRPPFRSAGR